MNRRKLLQLFAVIPFIGVFLEDPAGASQEQTIFLPTPPELDWWGHLANQLAINLDKYLEQNSVSTEERYYLHLMSYQFCRSLRNWELSAKDFPEQKIDVLSDIKFVAMKLPMDMIIHPDNGKNVILTAQSRKLRVIRSLCGSPFWDGNETIRSETKAFIEAGEQAALDVQIELRHSLKEGRPVRVYAIYTPPFLSSMAYVPKDFSGHRGFMIRYAKVY